MKSVALRALRNARLASKRTIIPARAYATVRDPKHKDPVELDQVTTLSNGIRVATESLPGPFSGVGVYIDAGSRYEDESLRGASHIVDRLAFKSTKQRSGDEMLEALESLGGNVHCASSREALMYQAFPFNSAVPTATALLAETIRDPKNTSEEIDQQLETAAYEINEIWSKPDLIIPELLHMAAYKDNTLGNPLLCPKDRLSYINQPLIEKYRKTFYKPERTVVAFVGTEHEEAVKLTEKWFGDMKAGEISSNASQQQAQSSARNSNFAQQQPRNFSTSAANSATVSPLDPTLLQPAPATNLNQPSHYTGGYLALPPLPNTEHHPHLPPTFSHIHIAFEALPISSPDIYALAVLQTLLGGGGSFSAGGPGKGMYSRLYTNVLNQHAWVESCVAFNHSYTDSGVFGIAASCLPGKVGTMVDVICRELQNLQLEHGFTSLQATEVNRAKNQLRFSLLSNLESRPVELEDLGRQVQVHGRKVGVKEMCQKIDDLTITDLRRVARLVFTGAVQNPGNGSGAPTVVVQEVDDGKRPILWEDVQQRLSRWHLGRAFA